MTRNGADAMLDALVANGVAICFANPGTTEMPFVAALDRRDDIRSVLGLFEGVCSGAADGYARIANRPAATLLHLGPGLANASANLHNARRAQTPIVNLVGDHTTWHLPYDAPLTSDIVSLASTTSVWVGTTSDATTAAADAAAAVQAAVNLGGSATLIVPVDHQYGLVETNSGAGVPVAAFNPPAPPTGDELAKIVSVLRDANNPAIMLGGSANGASAQLAAAAIAEAVGATLWSETYPAAVERGAGLPNAPRLPYYPEAAQKALAPHDVIVLAGALAPVSYFGYEGMPSELVEADRIVALAGPRDAGVALEALAQSLGVQAASLPSAILPIFDRNDRLSGDVVGAVVANGLPDNAIVSIEGGTCGYPFTQQSAGSPQHTVMTNTGGAIGQGLPAALGAALAAPDRTVIALQSDGSAQYTVQALWTIARERLGVVTLIAANQRYQILQNELRRIGSETFGPTATALTEFEPNVDWVAIANDYGMAADRVSTAGELADRLAAAVDVARQGIPTLIEMAL